VAATEVDVLGAVEIPQAASFGSVEEHGMADGSVESRGGGDASGEIVLGLFVLLGDSAHG
jgi:hypothetical protein